MVTPKEHKKPLPDENYQRAQQFIEQSIAAMEDQGSHIEYRSTIERKQPPSKWKQWLNRLQDLFS